MTKQDEIDLLRAELEQERHITETVFNWIGRTRSHLDLPKFREDTTIQTADVQSFLNNLRSAILDIQAEPWGFAHSIHGAVGRRDSDYVRFKAWEPGNPRSHTGRCC